jgi:glycosyltransferase involved in cell wall biosynthesis
MAAEVTRKIALVVDKPGWAFHRIAKEIKKYSYKSLEYQIYAIDKPKSWQRVYDVLSNENDLVHFFWRPATKHLVRNHKSKITTSVYDHLDETISDLWRPNNPAITSFWVSSRRLQDYYAGTNTRIIPPVLQDGVAVNEIIDKEPRDSDSFVFGWVGNSMWGNKDHKGLETIVRPSIEELKQKGYSVELNIADASVKQVLHANMKTFYAGIDCLLCASRSEGTPNPILEASAYGLPWISTDVGIVREVATPSQLEFIVGRDVGDFTIAMEKMINSPESVRKIRNESKENRDFWSWENRASAINNFFETTLKEGHP